jgi:putative ABC transport system substrate-binding protein
VIPVSKRLWQRGLLAGVVSVLFMTCVPAISWASMVGLILPKDCAFNPDAKDKFSSYLRASGINDADILLQRPASDKVSRINSMRKFLAIGADVIIVWGGTSLKEIAGEAGKTPIVFIGAWDPVKSGIIKDLTRPGSNITGVMGRTSIPFLIDNILEATASRTLGVVYHSQVIDSVAQHDELTDVASGKGLDLLTADLGNLSYEEAAATLQPAPFLYLAQGCAVENGVYEALAGMNKPAATQNPGVTGGGVIFTLAPDMEETIRVASDITGRILRGEKPGDIAVARITKISFTINVGEAQRLGVKIPFGVLNRATEVIR